MGRKRTLSPLFGEAVAAFKRSESIERLPEAGSFQDILGRAQEWFKHPAGGLTGEQKRELGRAAKAEGVKDVWIVSTRRVSVTDKKTGEKRTRVYSQKRDVLTGRWLSWGDKK